MTDNAIRARSLAKTFPARRGAGPVHAVRGVDLDVSPGEVIGLLGPNGAGKSTLIDMILGLTTPTGGELRVFGASPRAAVRAGRVGAMLQSGGLLPDLRVKDTVRMIAATHPHPLPVDRVLAEADLTGIADRRVGSCSGGQQQRLRFALAVLADPDLLILDEPTAGMDAAARHDFWRAMHAQAERGRTIVFATHYIEEAQDFAERIIMVGAGRILADGPTDVVRRQVAGAAVSAVLPPGLDPYSLPGVLAVDRDGARTRLSTADSDALARHLLTATDARELAISPASLEDAFLALTDAGHPSDPHDAATPGKA